MQLMFKYTPTIVAWGEATRVVDRAHMVLQSDHIIDIQDTGARGFD